MALHKTLDARGERHVLPVAADHPDGRRSISLVQIVTAFQGCTLLDVTLKTGRTHQIRVHVASLGHPILGDRLYGRGRDAKLPAAAGSLDRILLHARRLGFVHPVTGKELSFDVPPPARFDAILELLRA